ncbi:MAG: LysR family transcriptional regulator [Rhodococcus sp. (in: high G+C Gram-positive bacteria)]|uniref:LysR family transcriptional regulator n=1 Tax=Rhodococcus sp. TaxID=1831 RepID=UPI002ADAE265|nr:LysR family transcriptional regulator [Rhodococcus sp. (in: high G+C Gram-positive bacteria)]
MKPENIIECMSNFDGSALDGHLLKLLLAVLETGSITAAAERLGVTQSAVSHLLDKLRAITGDPLFVKRGRGIVPTARAEALAQPARDMLHQTAAASPTGADLTRRAGRPPSPSPPTTFSATCCCPRWPRACALPHRASRCASCPAARPGWTCCGLTRASWSSAPARPRAPTSCKSVCLKTSTACSTTPACAAPPPPRPTTWPQTTPPWPTKPTGGWTWTSQLLARGVRRRFAVRVPGFAALPAFVRGTALLTTAPSLLARTALAGLASAPVPVVCPAMPMYLIWHVRYQQDAAHRWLRGEVEAVVGPVLSK